ncbi:unnamed protein product [Trichobilharzia szidati]|nr:unnamed protein product [Trichobilharzia szidati]
MSRQISQKRSDQYLKRQHSMKTDESHTEESKYLEPYDTRSNSVQRLRGNPSVPYELHSNVDYIARRYPGPANINSTSKSVSPRLLNVLNPSPSAHSSLVAVSRVSQQPSFESYDSSMSAASWTSSNDPDLSASGSRYIHDPRSVSPNQLNISSALSVSPQSKERNMQLEYNTTNLNNVSNNRNNAKIDNRETELKSNDETKSSLKYTKAKEMFQSRKKNPLFRSITFDNDSSLSNEMPSISSSSSISQLKTTQKRSSSAKKLNNSDEKANRDLLKEMADLKIIGMKKESSGDLKSTASSGPQNIKGLWKRAFQSLRKDKNEKDQFKRKENGSQGGDAQTPEGEIDPVYHLLRCAASKSQSTALATTGLTNAKTNLKPKSTNPDTSQTNSGDSGQSSRLDNYEVNPYTGSMILRKTSPSVTFKQNESERCRLDEYLLDNNSNNNNNVTLITDNNNNNNQINNYNQNTESENNSSRFNENKSTKNNVLIPTNVKLIPPNSISEQQQIINLNEAELAYEQHKRMNPRQKASRSGQKSPSFLVEEDQQSYVIDYDQEVEPKSSRSTYEIKSYKPFTGNNPKSFPSAQRPSNERMYTLNRMKMMSMEENEDDEPSIVDDVQKFQKINHNVNYFRTEHTASSSSHKYAQNFSSQSNKQNNYDDVVQSSQQVTNVEDRTRKNPLLSTKSFSLDVPRFDQPNESIIGGSGGSSPGRYSEGPRKSSVAKYPQCLSSRMSPSLFSARMNEPSFYTHVEHFPYEETSTINNPHSVQVHVNDPDSTYHLSMNERAGRRRISPVGNVSSRSRLTSTNRMLPTPILPRIKAQQIQKSPTCGYQRINCNYIMQ